MADGSRELREHLALLKKIAKYQKDMGSGFDGYLDGIKKLGMQQAQIEHLLTSQYQLHEKIIDLELRKSRATGVVADDLQDQIDAAIELNDAYEEGIAFEQQHLDLLRESTQQVSLLNVGYKSMGKAWNKIPGQAKKMYGWVSSMAALDMSKDIKQAELSMGVLSNQSKFFSKTMSDASKSTIQIGIGVSDLAKSQAEYSESIGRNMMLSEDQYQAMAEMAKGTVLGVQGAAEMAASMETFGLSVEGSRDMIQETVDAAQSMGTNTSKTIKELSNALKLAQRYHFKGGIKGMASMASYAAKMGMDMANVAGMAEKVFRPEGAVEMSARLATMGGQMARLGDPFTLMFKARNDLEGFMKDVGAAAEEFAQFNEKTGEFDITGLQLDRMRELADITGLSVEEMSKLAREGAKFSKIERLIPASIVSDEDRDLISSMASYDAKSKQWEVTINGDTKFLSDLDQTELDIYKRDQESLKERAKQAQTFDDAFNNLVMQFKTVGLPFVEALNEHFVPALIEFQKKLIDEGWIDKLKEVAEDVASFVVGVGKVAKTFIDIFGIKGTAIALGLTTVFFNAAQWYANGVALAKGFNMASGEGGGLFDMFTGGGKKGKKGKSKIPKMGKMGKLSKLGKFAAPLALLGAGMDGITNAGDDSLTGGQAVGKTLDQNKFMGMGAGLGLLGGPFAPLTVAGGAGIGAIIDLIANNMLGDDALIGHHMGQYNMDDGIIKFNPQDKFLQMDDGMVASTDKGKIDDIAKTSKDSGGKTKVEFGDLNIKGEITLKDNNGNKINSNLLKDPFFIKEITSMIQQQLSINLSGGKLNPNPA